MQHPQTVSALQNVLRSQDMQEPMALAQDSDLVAFSDINPAAQQHILVISKAHIPSLYDLQATQADIRLGELPQRTFRRFSIERYRAVSPGADL